MAKKQKPQTTSIAYQPSNWMFVITELLVFVSQVFVFFLVAVFTSDFLGNEERLTEFIKTKINNHTWGEFGFTMLAITVTLGVIAFIKQITTSKLIEDLAQEVFNEFPRTIYVFGSSITAIMLAIAAYLYKQPPTVSKPATTYFFMAGLFALATFAYGFSIKAVLTVRARKITQDTDATQ